MSATFLKSSCQDFNPTEWIMLFSYSVLYWQIRLVSPFPYHKLQLINNNRTSDWISCSELSLYLRWKANDGDEKYRDHSIAKERNCNRTLSVTWDMIYSIATISNKNNQFSVQIQIAIRSILLTNSISCKPKWKTNLTVFCVESDFPSVKPILWECPKIQNKWTVTPPIWPKWFARTLRVSRQAVWRGDLRTDLHFSHSSPPPHPQRSWQALLGPCFIVASLILSLHYTLHSADTVIFPKQSRLSTPVQCYTTTFRDFGKQKARSLGSWSGPCLPSPHFLLHSPGLPTG